MEGVVSLEWRADCEVAVRALQQGFGRWGDVGAGFIFLACVVFVVCWKKK